jgi:two-component system response regulator HydG
VDVRLISATNRDPQEAIAKGLFREDLFFRLNVVSIHLPPLRERKEDIPLLVDHFLKVFSRRQGKAIEGFSSKAMKTLTEYTWPGNVRELENTMERLVVFARDKTITSEDLVYSNTLFSQIVETEPTSLEEMERRHVIKVLARTNGNKSRAAQLLGIDRKTLRTKLRKYQISPSQ